jgi:hypothetical protein
MFTATTFVTLTLAAAASVLWATGIPGSSRLEPVVEALALLAALAGIVAERRAAAQERRRLALLSLESEITRIGEILADPRFAPAGESTPKPSVYPRLPLSAADAALNSGTLASRRDAGLLSQLHQWRDEVAEFNRRLDLTEVRLFTARVPAEVVEFDRALHRPGGHLDSIRSDLAELHAYLATHYHRPLTGNPAARRST